MSDNYTSGRFPVSELNLVNHRNMRLRNERAKRAAIAAIGRAGVPRYKARKSPTNARKAAVRAAKLAAKHRAIRDGVGS